MKNFITVLKKELKVIFRDKKALLFTILLPLILYPSMFGFLSTTINRSNDINNMEIKATIEGNKESSFVSILESNKKIKFIEVDDSEKALKKGDIQIILKIPDGFGSSNSNSKLEILYDNESNKSINSNQVFVSMMESYKNSLIESNLQQQGIDLSILTPISYESKSEINSNSDNNAFATMLFSMLPTLLIIFMVSSTVSMASDLAAGEKEKCTFEPLLSTQAKRTSIFWGKIGSLCVVSFITLLTNILAMVLSMNLFMNDKGTIDINLGIPTILGVVLVAILVLVTLSAVQMAVSLYARSTKEAGTFLAGVILPIFLLANIPMMIDSKDINFIFFNVPIANAACLMKEFMVGIYNLQHILIVVAWFFVYIICAILFAKYLFSKEEVVFRN